MSNDVSNYGEGSTQTSSLMVNYSTTGTKQASVKVTDEAGSTAVANCTANIGMREI